MKKILSILGLITLAGTNIKSLVSCQNPQYSEYELKKEKENNKIVTKYGILEGLIPQEKPFKNIDNKYYFVVGHSYKKNVGRIIKFINNADIIKIDDSDGRQLEKIDLGVSMGKSLYITNKSGFIKYVTHGKKK